VLDRPAKLERQARRREAKRRRDARHRARLRDGITMVTIPVDCGLVGWLRRTRWLTGPREGRAELEDALTRLLQDSARH
jgi:hypothetical protein